MDISIRSPGTPPAALISSTAIHAPGAHGLRRSAAGDTEFGVDAEAGGRTARQEEEEERRAALADSRCDSFLAIPAAYRPGIQATTNVSILSYSGNAVGPAGAGPTALG